MKRFQGIVLAALAVFVTVGFVMPAPTANAVSSAALSIVPKKNYLIEPGKSVDDKLTIRNLDSNHPLELTLRVVDFTFTDDGGTPKLFMDPNAPQTTWSLKPFMTVPKTVSIPPSASKTLDMRVAIPAGHGAGSYYSAIVYSSGGASEGGNVGLSASGVTLVFTSIPGKVNEDLKLEKFGAYVNATASSKAHYSFFNLDEPNMMAYTLKNNGNVTESPAGTITLKNVLFGKQYVIDDLNPNGSLALIGQSRTFTSCIKTKEQSVDFGGEKTEAKQCTSPGIWPGIYKAEINGFYGQNGNNTKEFTGGALFLYLPGWFLILLVIIIAFAAYYIRKLVLKIRGMRGKKPKFRRK